jgi:hypothetical protein
MRTERVTHSSTVPAISYLEKLARQAGERRARRREQEKAPNR